MTTFNNLFERAMPDGIPEADPALPDYELRIRSAFGPLPDTDAGVALELGAVVQERLAAYDLDTIRYAPGFDYSQVEDTEDDESIVEAAPEIEQRPDYSQYFNPYHLEFDY